MCGMRAIETIQMHECKSPLVRVGRSTTTTTTITTTTTTATTTNKFLFFAVLTTYGRLF